MRNILLSVTVAAGIAGAFAASLPQPAQAASLLPAIAGPGDTANVQRVAWVWVGSQRVWRADPVVVVHPVAPVVVVRPIAPVVVVHPAAVGVWSWHGRNWSHRDWRDGGWHYY
ncbi:MAG TPA: hypothetical protein VJY39_08665 [Acidisphaera sp.]|nr:hypothetical protein [Acidisphaera sp.]